jgi:predicted transcriptional regulator/transcriptional regulator with XRE-family HTH domain
MSVRKILLGYKVRHLRRERGISQVGLAKRLGISSSYLNLIEHNRRPLTPPMLLKVSQIFEVAPEAFSGDEEEQLLTRLEEVLGDTLYQDRGIEGISTGDSCELVATQPDMVQAFLTLYAAYREAHEDAQALSERLYDDSYLSNSVHEVLTLMTTIRSFSEILHDNRGLSPEQRERFFQIMTEETEQLTQVINRLRDFSRESGVSHPMAGKAASEEFTNFIEGRGNYFTEIEDAAQDLRHKALSQDAGLHEGLVRGLMRDHGVAVTMVPWKDLGTAVSHHDQDSGKLLLSAELSPARQTFHVAQLAARLAYRKIFEACLADTRPTSAQSHGLGIDTLAKYLAGAVLMPYRSFRDAALELRYDIEALQYRFTTSFEQTCHRLTTLQRPLAHGIPFHFMRIDIAGNVSKRYSGSGMHIPRYGGLCPRWNIHTAFISPGTIQRQIAQMPDGSTYFCLARTISRQGIGYRMPMSHLAVGIGCEISHAHGLVYADGMNLDSQDAITPVGAGCRFCDRNDCRQRAFPFTTGRG